MITYVTTPQFIRIDGLPYGKMMHVRIRAHINRKTYKHSEIAMQRLIIDPSMLDMDHRFLVDVYTVRIQHPDMEWVHSFPLRFNAGCKNIGKKNLETFWLEQALVYAEHCRDVSPENLALILRKYLDVAGTADPHYDKGWYIETTGDAWVIDTEGGDQGWVIKAQSRADHGSCV